MAGSMAAAGEEHGSDAFQQTPPVSHSVGDSPGIASAIRRTVPVLSEASVNFLAEQVRAGRCPEFQEQVRLSEEGRVQTPHSALSSRLVSCPSTSAFLIDYVEALLGILIRRQVFYFAHVFHFMCAQQIAGKPGPSIVRNVVTNLRRSFQSPIRTCFLQSPIRTCHSENGVQGAGGMSQRPSPLNSTSVGSGEG